MRLADETASAGGALAVDREAFATRVTETINAHPRIDLVREEMPEISRHSRDHRSGPLTLSRLSQAIAALSGRRISRIRCHFPDCDAGIGQF